MTTGGGPVSRRSNPKCLLIKIMVENEIQPFINLRQDTKSQGCLVLSIYTVIGFFSRCPIL